MLLSTWQSIGAILGLAASEVKKTGDCEGHSRLYICLCIAFLMLDIGVSLWKTARMADDYSRCNCSACASDAFNKQVGSFLFPDWKLDVLPVLYGKHTTVTIAMGSHSNTLQLDIVWHTTTYVVKSYVGMDNLMSCVLPSLSLGYKFKGWQQPVFHLGRKERDVDRTWQSE